MNNIVNDYDKLSILDKSAHELLMMDLGELRRIFLDEVNTLGENSRDAGKILVDKLVKFIPHSGDNENSSNVEIRLFIDLLSTPGLLEIDYVRDYLTYLYRNINTLNPDVALLSKIFMFYNNHTDEEIEKFNYVFKSTREMADLKYSNYPLKDLFNSRVLRLFDKEDLCFLYRNYISLYDCPLYDLVDEKNHKVLYMMALMGKKVKSLVGRNQEFLQNMMAMIYEEETSGFKKFLMKFYDTYVGGRWDEEDFEKLLLENDDIYEINDLIQSIMNYNGVSIYNNFKFFKKSIRSQKNECHSYVFKDGFEKKIKNGTFDINSDFRDINDDVDLKSFKEAVLSNFYGVGLNKAKELIRSYGLFIDDLEREVIQEDKGILEILKAIKRIVDIKIDDDLKISSLQLMYYEKMKETNFNYMAKYYAPYMLKVLLKRMVINTYNNKLLDVDKSNLNIIDNDNGTLVYDSGNDFTIMLTSLAGIKDFYNPDFNMAVKWNTSFLASNNGLCCSHIENCNLGVINLHSVLLGFDNIPQYSLQKMGISDIYSKSKNFKTRKLFSKYFYPRGTNIRESRYGYDEFFIDRFLTVDDKNTLKLQPSYVVFYKFDDNYKDTDVYKKSLKTAKDFKIPIVLVDVKRVKEEEQRQILELEEELLSKDKCDRELMRDIINRYMSNYTGSLTMVGTSSVMYEEDFSVKGMDNFFNMFFLKINTLSWDEKVQWLDILEDIYYEEEVKFKTAKRVIPYAYSVKEFGLNRYDLLNKIDCVRKGKSFGENKRKQSTIFVDKNGSLLSGYGTATEEDDLYCEQKITDIDFSKSVINISFKIPHYDSFLRDKECTAEIKSMVLFMKYLHTSSWCNFGSILDITENYELMNGLSGAIITNQETANLEDILVENLIMSYFFESDRMVVDDMISHRFDCDVSFKVTDDFDFGEMINNSHSYKFFFDKNSHHHIPLNLGRINTVLELVDDMSNEDFLKVFYPVMEKYSLENGQRFESVASNLLDKKKNMREAFNSFGNNLSKDNLVKK